MPKRKPIKAVKAVKAYVMANSVLNYVIYNGSNTDTRLGCIERHLDHCAGQSWGDLKIGGDFVQRVLITPLPTPGKRKR